MKKSGEVPPRNRKAMATNVARHGGQARQREQFRHGGQARQLGQARDGDQALWSDSETASGTPRKEAGDMARNSAASTKHDDFPVVALGASAGGLEAFTQLLRALPADTGMAFVFIQHLDPKHHSVLPDLLAKVSAMQVEEAKNGTKLEANRVYVIPPNVNMRLHGDRLRLTPRAELPGLHTPVDFFMSSLAESRGRRAIGVVLSGTASDGTRGLMAIKAEGGITFAQDEKSAKYDGMPHSAAASGAVDFVLAPEKIAEELARIGRHDYLKLPQPIGSGGRATKVKVKVKEARTSERGFDRVFALLRRGCGINFSEYKPGTLQRRTLRRMAIQKIDGVAEYAKFLERHPAERENLCQDLLIPVTSFFRDLQAFDGLKSKVFPAIVKDKSNKGSIRIWAPGCSTGEETYSLAIELLEFLGDGSSAFNIQLFGTDVNERGIEKARAGVYQERIAQEIAPDRLRRFFTRVEEGYRVVKSVRELCVFAKQNLADDPPFSQMNLVACRNLLIYLGPALQKKIMPILHYALRPSGFLFLGSSETAAAYPELFSIADKKHKIFIKRAVAARLHYDFSGNRYPRETRIGPGGLEHGAPAEPPDTQQEADRAVLRDYAPPAAVINDGMEILQFRGQIGPYLQPSHGRASLHLLKIARGEFVADLRSAVTQAIRSRGLVKRRAVEFREKSELRAVDISVQPLGPPESNQYLVVFQEAILAHPAPGKSARVPRGASATAKHEIASLRRKAAAAEEHLRAVIESKEASDEEAQSSNEEILSANEELQSTNEELETSKEELQSANEELNTVNDELHNRNLDLDRLNNDLSNLIASTTIPIVMVDRGLRIRRMTAAAAKVFKVRPSDMGRPLMDMRPDLSVTNFDQLISGVLDTLTPVDVDVHDKSDHWYSLHIRPYRTSEDKIDGAILALNDIHAMKQLNETLQRSEEFLDDILSTVREPLLVLDEDLKVLYANPSFLKGFGVSVEETVENALYRLGNEQWNIPSLRAALERVMETDEPMADFEVERDFPALGNRAMLLNARKIKERAKGEPMLLLAIEDVTERKRVADEVKRSRAGLETLVERRTAALRELSAQLLKSQDAERRRIARELHDGMGQNLVLAKIILAEIKPKAGERGGKAKAFANLAEMLNKCIGEARTMSYLLHPPLLEESGLGSALKAYLEGFSQRSGIAVNLSVPEELPRLPEAIELALFRILQESLTNVSRHSRSRSADIRINHDDHRVTLEVRDQGEGMSRESSERLAAGRAGGGVGLRSMKERAAELGGTLEIQSGGGGTMIRVAIPVPDSGEPASPAETAGQEQ